MVVTGYEHGDRRGLMGDGPQKIGIQGICRSGARQGNVTNAQLQSEVLINDVDIGTRVYECRDDVCRGQDLSDNQLLRVAKKMGQEWEEAAIYLKLSMTDLDNIKAERQTSVSMQKLRMLVLWKNRRPRGEATAQHLLRSLEDLQDLSSEARQILE
ncbi:hypothetical protein NHX12_008956, partial [Muraenolepis orangiensis]